MKEDFLITINSKQIVSGKEDEISLKARGSYEFSNDRKKISFYEYDQENPEKKYLSSLLVENDGKIIFTKGGSVNSQLMLQKGKRHMCNYLTDYGVLQLGTFTDMVDIDFDETGGDFKAEYTIDINSSIASRNFVHMKVRKVDKNV